MEKLYLLSADIYRQAYLQILSADIIIGRTLPPSSPSDVYMISGRSLFLRKPRIEQTAQL